MNHGQTYLIIALYMPSFTGFKQGLSEYNKTMENLLELSTRHQNLFAWVAIAAGALLVLIILVTPLVIAAIPDDYFDQKKRPSLGPNPGSNGPYHFFVFFVLKLAKNTLGALLVFSGIAMLVLPGQGVLTILVGLLLMNYPGKYAFERKLISQPRVLAIINWMRVKQNKKPFKL